MSYKSSLIEAIEASHAVLHMLGSVFKSLCVFECCVYRSVFLRSLRIRPTMSLSYTYWFLDTVLEKFFMGSRFCYCKILQLMVKIILNLQWCKIYFNVTILHFECVGDGHKNILLVYLVCKMHVWFFGGGFLSKTWCMSICCAFHKCTSTMGDTEHNIYRDFLVPNEYSIS